MRTIYAHVEDELYERFKAEINKRYRGIKKGDMTKAVVEAVQLWIRSK